MENTELSDSTQFLFFDIRTLQYFLDEPPMAYVVQGIFVEGFIHILAGQAGIGKSLFAMELARSVAGGDPFLGIYDVEKPGPVLVVDSENPSSLIRDRIIKMQILPTLPIYYLHFADVRINQPEWISGIIQLLKYLKPRLVIFDSLARFHNLTENSAEGMAQISGGLREISNFLIQGGSDEEPEEWCPAVLMLHHANKQPISGLISRGSGEIPAGCDIEYGLTYKGALREFRSYKTRISQVDPFCLEIKDSEDSLTIEAHAAGEVVDDIEGILAEQPGPISQTELMGLIRTKLNFGINKSLSYIKNGVTSGRWFEVKGESSGGRKPLLYTLKNDSKSKDFSTA